MNLLSSLMTRRELLRRSGMGFASLGLAQLLQSEKALEATPLTSPLAVRQPHFPGKAKRVLQILDPQIRQSRRPRAQ